MFHSHHCKLLLQAQLRCVGVAVWDFIGSSGVLCHFETVTAGYVCA